MESPQILSVQRHIRRAGNVYRKNDRFFLAIYVHASRQKNFLTQPGAGVRETTRHFVEAPDAAINRALDNINSIAVIIVAAVQGAEEAIEKSDVGVDHLGDACSIFR